MAHMIAAASLARRAVSSTAVTISDIPLPYWLVVMATAVTAIVAYVKIHEPIALGGLGKDHDNPA